MGSRIAWRLAVTAVALTMTAGCGGKASPSPEASGAAASTPTASPAPSTTGSPTSSTPAIDPNIPAAARAQTSDGGVAFIRYFFAQLNSAWSRPQAGLVKQLSSAACKTCRNFEETASTSVSKQHHVVGASFVIESIKPTQNSASHHPTFITRGYQPATRVLDASGRSVESVPRGVTNAYITLEWQSGAWKVAEIQEIS